MPIDSEGSANSMAMMLDVVFCGPRAERFAPGSRCLAAAPRLNQRLAKDCDALIGRVLSDAEVEAALSRGLRALADVASLVTARGGEQRWLWGSESQVVASGWWVVPDSSRWGEAILAPEDPPASGRYLRSYVGAWVERGAIRDCELSVRGGQGAGLTLAAWLASSASRWEQLGVVPEVYDDYLGPTVLFWEDRAATGAGGPLVRLREAGDLDSTRFAWDSKLSQSDRWPSGGQSGERPIATSEAAFALELCSPEGVGSDWTWMSNGQDVIASQRLVRLLEGHHATGWRAAPVVRAQRADEGTLTGRDYASSGAWSNDPNDPMLPYVLRVEGRIGAPNWSVASQTSLSGYPTSEVVGWPADLNTWDGSDLCRCPETGEVLVSKRIADAIVEAGLVAMNSQEADAERSIILTPMERVRTRRTAPQLLAAGMPVPDYLWLREPVDSRPAHLRRFGVI